jgi:hypothetical protein
LTYARDHHDHEWKPANGLAGELHHRRLLTKTLGT